MKTPRIVLTKPPGMPLLMVSRRGSIVTTTFGPNTSLLEGVAAAASVVRCALELPAEVRQKAAALVAEIERHTGTGMAARVVHDEVAHHEQD